MQLTEMYNQLQYIMDQILCVLISAQSELLLFCGAFALHYFLFGNAWPRGKSTKKASRTPPKSAPSPQREGSEDAGCRRIFDDDVDAYSDGEASQARTAYYRGDHRAVLRIWNGLRRKGGANTGRDSPEVPAVLLSQMVESMQRVKKDSRTILSEVVGYLHRNVGLCDISYINGLLEPLARSLDAEVVRGIVESLPSLHIAADGATYELLMQMCFATRSFTEVMAISDQMKCEGIAPTPRVSLVLLKCAVQTGNLEEALKRYREVGGVDSTGGHAVSSAPRHIATQLVELACREHRAGLAVDELEAGSMPLTSEMLNSLLAECAGGHDPDLMRRVQGLCSSQNVPKSGRTYSLLIRSAGNDRARIMSLLDEMVAEGMSDCASEVANSVLAASLLSEDTSLADRLCGLIRADHSGQAPALLALIRFYADASMPEKVCELYDKLVRASGGLDGDLKRRTLIDTRTEKCVISSALQCGRHDLAKQLFEAAPADIAKHISMIRSCASRGNLDEALRTFEALRASGAEVTHSLWNTALDACVECSDLRRAGQLMQQMVSVDVADVVSYNTLIKAHLRQEQYDRAWALVEEMRKVGHPPNHVTYNELVNALVRNEKRRGQVWEIIDEMKSCGAKPNRITCSILLKSLKTKSPHADVMRTLELTDSMDEAMDEVLLSSVVEACVRVGKPALLAQRLAKLQGKDAITITGAHTFGSLIKAYGYAKDVSGAWRCWKEMRSQHVKPTSITIGCMVEAVVSNGDCDGGCELVNTLLDDERCKDQVNAVVFGSVLKGYSRSKCMERVWDVFADMLARGIEPSVVTFNAVVDACARNAQMDRVPGLIKQMQTRGLKPNLITYSTIMKGYCQRGDMPAAFAALEELRCGAAGCCKPDEVVYNTLLDGCAQAGLATESERLLREMQTDGIQPTNYTLTVVVKVLGQARRVDRAFELVELLTSKYRFRANSHVCSALIQACLSSKETARAATAFDRAARDRLQIDCRTCHSLLRAHLSAGLYAKAVGLLRTMLGLNGEAPLMFTGDRNSNASNGTALDDSFLGDVLNALLASSNDAALAPPLLADLRSARPRMRLNADIDRRVAALW